MIHNAKEDSLKGGYEIMRIISLTTNFAELNDLFSEIRENTACMLQPIKTEPINNIYITVLIPISIQRKLDYLFREIDGKNGSRYVQWL